MGHTNCSLLLALWILITALSLPEQAMAGETVFGGDKVAKGANYHYLIQLVANSDTVCGGIAVGPKWVLTAAHCASLPTHAIPFSGQGTLILNRFCHPSYQPSTVPQLNSRFDLAVLETKDQLGGSWQRADVAEPAPNNLLVFGWGKTSFLGLISGVSPLRKSKAMPLQDSRDAFGVLKCDRRWNALGQIVDTEELCAGGPASSACLGDSGGPLFNSVSTSSGLEPDKLVGILSKADDNCDASGIYDIYTRVDSDWVEKIVTGDIVTQNQSTCP